MKNIIVILFAFVAITTQAENFYKSKLLMADGEIKQGYSSLPSNRLIDLSISFKTDKNGKTSSIAHNDIVQIVYTLDNGNQYLFERNKIVLINKNFHADSEKNGVFKSWMLATYYSPSVIVYNLAQSYYVNKDGEMISKAVDTTGTGADIDVLVRRPSEDYAAVITQITAGTTVIGKESSFRKKAAIYFSDYQPLVERIENKEFKSREVISVAKEYNAYKTKE